MPARPTPHALPSAPWRWTTSAWRVGGRCRPGMEVPKLDAGAARGVEFLRAVSQCARVLAVEPDRAGGLGSAAFEPDAHAVAREHRLRRVVGGKDGIETETQALAEEGQVCMQVAARQEELGPRRSARSGLRPRLVVRHTPPRRASHRLVPAIVAPRGCAGVAISEDFSWRAR